MNGKGFTYYPMHMHLHASCDRGASMALDMYNASKLGMQYIWFTDHDTRMGLMKNHITKYSFGDGLLKTDGKTYEGFEKINEQTNLLVDTAKKTLTINSVKSDDEWVSSGVYFASSGKRHTFSLAGELAVSVDLNEFMPNENARLIFAAKLSQRPPEMKHSYMLYVIGSADGLGDEYNQVIALDQTSGTVTMKLSEDVAENQHIGGKDNAFDTLYIVLQTKNGAQATVTVGDFEIKRDKVCEDLRQNLQKVADEAGKRYKVKPFVSFEISGAGEHKNCFSTAVPVIEYHKNNYQMAESDAIEHMKKYGGIFAINHPFATSHIKKLSKEMGELDDATKKQLFDHMYNEFVNNNALGATLMEVGFPEGRRFSFEDYLKLWDMLALGGVFLSGYGANDCHANNDGWFDGNNFVAYIGVDDSLTYPVDVKYFTDAMKKGRMYTGDPTAIKGRVGFETDKGDQMGSVVVADETESVKIKFSAEDTKIGWQFRIVENGKVVESAKIDKTKFEFDSVLKLNGNNVSFKRAEIYDENGRCILLTNPIYMTSKQFAIEHSGDIRLVERRTDN